jgi:hypothetical protein
MIHPRHEVLQHYYNMLDEARSPPAPLGLPAPKAVLPYDAECVLELLGTKWVADIRFNASSDGEGWLLEDIDVCLSPADVVFQSECGGYRVDFTELPESACEAIEAACERAYVNARDYDDFVEEMS